MVYARNWKEKGGFSLFAVIVYLAVISKKIIIWMVHLYQNKAPDAVRLRCVFEPSCSEYMILAIEKYGVVRGVWKGIQRLGRCHAPNGGKDYPVRMEKKGKIMLVNLPVSYLENNEAVALSVIEITSIPNLSIIDNNAEEAEIVKNYKRSGKPVAEIYQNYKVQSSMSGEEKDTALEILSIRRSEKISPIKQRLNVFACAFY